jgi:hypothetical protein
MEHGRPYQTDELDRIRSDQRQVLRTIPTHFVESRADGLPHFARPENPYDCAMVESVLREQAQELFNSGPVDLITRMRSNVEWGSLADHLATAPDLPAFPLSDAVEWLRHEAQTVGGEPIRDLGDQAHWLERLLVALVLADVLAGDGYKDPRLR